MKRHPALIPLSHDHHQGLSEARRLRRASDEDAAPRLAAVARFLDYFAATAVGYLRLEEEQLLPLLADAGEPAESLVVRALLDHQRIRWMVARLETAHAVGEAEPVPMRALAELVERNIRFEERELFPHLEQTVSDDALGRLARPATSGSSDATGTEAPRPG